MHYYLLKYAQGYHRQHYKQIHPFVTTLLAAMTAPSPTETPGNIVTLSPTHTFFPIITGPLLTIDRLDTGNCNVIRPVRP